MKHFVTVSRRPATADVCIDIPVVPGTMWQNTLKEILGWTQEDTGEVGATRWCKAI